MSETVGRNGKGKPKFEVNLNRYTRDAMGLSPYSPKSDDKGNIRSIKSYLLGERYLFTYIDIEPDLSVLDKNYEKDLTAKYGEIDSKYNGIILAGVNRYMADVSAKTQEKYDLQLIEYKIEIDDRLDSDVINNSDKDVCKAYQGEITQLNSCQNRSNQTLKIVCSRKRQTNRCFKR